MIYRRKDSPYYWCSFYDKESNRVRLSTKKRDRRSARGEAARLEYIYQPSQKQKTDLEKIKDRYLKYSLANNSRTTFDRESSILYRFCEWVGNKAIEPLLVENYKDHRSPLVSKRTINREYDAIRSMFNMAVTWKMIEANPCHEVKKYKISRLRKSPDFFSKREVDLILHKSKNNYFHDMIMLAVHTGLRRQELVYLQWRDINLTNWTVTVQAKDELGWQPKGGELRIIPIPRPCHQMLRERTVKSLSEFVFPNQFGGPRTNNLNRDLRDFLKRTGLHKKGVGWHTLRHTYASHLAMKGAPLNSIAELLGHKDPVTTKIYAHLSPSHLKDMTDRLDFTLSRKRKIVTKKRDKKVGKSEQKRH